MSKFPFDKCFHYTLCSQLVVEGWATLPVMAFSSAELRKCSMDEFDLALFAYLAAFGVPIGLDIEKRPSIAAIYAPLKMWLAKGEGDILVGIKQFLGTVWFEIVYLFDEPMNAQSIVKGETELIEGKGGNGSIILKYSISNPVIQIDIAE